MRLHLGPYGLIREKITVDSITIQHSGPVMWADNVLLDVVPCFRLLPAG
jgi:hypothetical protein